MNYLKFHLSNLLAAKLLDIFKVYVQLCCVLQLNLNHDELTFITILNPNSSIFYHMFISSFLLSQTLLSSQGHQHIKTTLKSKNLGAKMNPAAFQIETQHCPHPTDLCIMQCALDHSFTFHSEVNISTNSSVFGLPSS